MFVVATILTATIAIFLQYYFTKELAKEHILSRYAGASTTITEYINKLDYDASYTTELFAKIAQQHYSQSDDNQALAKVFAEALRANNNLYGMYVGKENDDFFQLINLNASILLRDRIGATHEDRWALVTHTDIKQQRTKTTYYLSDDFAVRKVEQEPSNYYPTQRPWYDIDEDGQVSKTEPYLFANLKITGQTYSMSIPEHKAVIGVDIVLSSISSNFAENVKVNNGNGKAEAYLFSASGEIVASNQTLEASVEIPQGTPLDLTKVQQGIIDKARSLKVSNQNDWAPIDFTLAGEPKGYAIDLLNIIQESSGLNFEYINGRSWSELVSDYREGTIDILHSIQQHGHNQDLGAFSRPIYELPFGLVTLNNTDVVSNLRDWDGKTLGMLDGWSIIPKLLELYPDIELKTYPSLHLAFTALEKGEVEGVLETDAILKHKLAQTFHEKFKLQPRLDDINNVFPSSFYLVMNEVDSDIVSIIDLALNNITLEQRQALHQKWLEAEFGKPSAAFSATVPYKNLVQIARNPEQHNQLHLVQLGGIPQYMYVSMVGKAGGIQEYFAVVVSEEVVISGVKEKVVTSIFITAGLMFLLLPIAWLFGTPIVRPITRLQDETLKIKNRQYDDVEYVDTPIKEIWELSSSIYRMSLDIKNHEKAQEEFIEAIIKLIAEAIDDKSPYTAGHCNRVPEIGIMLAEAVEAVNEGKFKNFKFANNDERREFRIAAWLHDCGKITIPEHIIDKGSKLEANYNRIHEVRMRFEVLWRDAEIEALKQLTSKVEDPARIQAELENKQAKLHEDFAFIATANVGGEFMSDDKVARIKELATQTWTRHFDDRLGLSPAEDLAITVPSAPLPAQEQLLSDRPEHIIPRTHSTDYDPKLNIKMTVPEHMYNQGEVYNLTIARGTLTTEDRFKINEHMISGIKMLESLPFPKELSRVPRYASTHHETLKGTGYPRKLTGDDLSIPERILVIADIFEALTAADRPYKKAKPLSVAIDIMYKMALDEHFDMDLFRLFLTSGTHLRYAKEYLPESQIDSVDINKYL
ncbi:HD domain-containing phosphohydrolase [Vibrio maerlii]|uniref:HD domain-containing phosphohydrolase n=1 Tax=Vibrio maerlii TaxID=2231648 RepID=UPI000E3BE7D2|nr:HD domain-containing phosphohydrolase [Vibrio maerlii]